MPAGSFFHLSGGITRIYFLPALISLIAVTANATVRFCSRKDSYHRFLYSAEHRFHLFN